MNNERRQRIRNSIKYLDKAIDILDDVKIEEEISFENLSDGLQQTYRGEQMEDNIELLENIIEKLDDIHKSLSEII